MLSGKCRDSLAEIAKWTGRYSYWDDNLGFNKLLTINGIIGVFVRLCMLFISILKVGKTVKVLSDNEYFVPQTRALISVVKKAWGEINKWDDVKLRDLGQLLKGLDKKEISMLIDDTVKVTRTNTALTRCSGSSCCSLMDSLSKFCMAVLWFLEKSPLEFFLGN